MMFVESYSPTDRRGSYEKVRCRTEEGTAEFDTEVTRLEKVRAEVGQEWEPMVVHLLWGDTVFQRKEIN